MIRRFFASGEWIMALVALVIALLGWVRGDGGRSQQLSDLDIAVRQIAAQQAKMGDRIDMIEAEFSQYLIANPKH